jgi:hypothetical protein
VTERGRAGVTQARARRARALLVVGLVLGVLGAVSGTARGDDDDPMEGKGQQPDPRVRQTSPVGNKPPASPPAARRGVSNPATIRLKERAWDEHVALGEFDPLRDQIAVRGPLALAPVNGIGAGVLVLDARIGEVLRFVRPPLDQGDRVSGVLLDGDDMVFAFDDVSGAEPGKQAASRRGLIAKVHLDGTYRWVASGAGSAAALPVLADLDGDGVRDAAMVTTAPDEVSAWNGINGQLLWRSPTPGCEASELNAIVIDSLGIRSSTVALACKVDPTRHLYFAGRTGQRLDLLESFAQVPFPDVVPIMDASSSPWLQAALLGYAAVDAPQASATCLAGIGATRCLSVVDDVFDAPFLEHGGWLAGGVFDDDRYGALLLDHRGYADAIVLEGDSSTALRDLQVQGGQVDLSTARTMSVDDVDGDGYWDVLLVDRTGALHAYATEGSGQLYRGLPHGDLQGTGMPSSTYATPDSARRDPRELEAWRATDSAAPHSAFAKRSESWQLAPDVDPGSRFARLTGATPHTPVAARLSRSDLTDWALLSDAQLSSHGLFAHDGLTLYVLRGDASGLARVKFEDVAGAPSPPISGLAVGERAVVLARGGRLTVCDGTGAGCKSLFPKPSDGRTVTAVSAGPNDGTFWVGFGDGSIDLYDGQALHHAAPARKGEPQRLAMVQLRDASVLVASGSDGTRVYPYEAAGEGKLGEPAVLPVELQQVLRCSLTAPVYARSRGALLETTTDLSALVRTQGAPSEIRALACAQDGGLLVLTKGQISYALAGPPPPPIWPYEFAFGLVASSGSAVLLRRRRIRQLARSATRAQSDETRDRVRNVIVPEEPLERLPADPTRHPSLRQLVHALLQLIDNEDTRPPATVGIYGAWGSGKSSVMLALRHELHATQRYVSVWFNPWRFHRESDVAAAMLQSVVNEVRSQLGLSGRLEVALKALVSQRALLTLSWMVPAGALSMYLAGDKLPQVVRSLLQLNFTSSDFGLESLLGTLTGGGVLSTALVQAGSKLFKVFGVSPSELVKAQTPAKSVDFFQRFSEDLAKVAAALPRQQEVIVFVDDLDRCPPEQTVAVLEALNLLAESKRIYLVLALDPRLVSRAIETHRKDMLAQMKERGERTDDYGARFLEKIVTLPVQVPPISAAEVSQTTADADVAPGADSRAQRVIAFLQRDPRALSGVWVLATGLLLSWVSAPVIGKTFEQIRTLRTAAVADPKAQRAESPSGQVSAPASQAAVPPASLTTLSSDGKASEKSAPEQSPEERPSSRSKRLYRRPLHALERLEVASTAFAAAQSEPATEPPDAAFQRGDAENQRRSVVLTLMLLALALVTVLLELQRRKQPDVPRRVRDSEAFAAALRTYLSELSANPRNVLRRANRARLLYLLDGECRPITEFFSALVVAERSERLRISSSPLLANAVTGADMTAMLLTRKPAPHFPADSEPYRVISSLPPSQFETVAPASMPAIHVLSRSMQNWIADTTT